jgi:hypothetical protein
VYADPTGVGVEPEDKRSLEWEDLRLFHTSEAADLDSDRIACIEVDREVEVEE